MIETYYTEPVTVTRKTRAKVNGVVKETTSEVWAGNIGFDKSTSSSLFSSDKEMFDYSAVAYAPIASGIIEDDILTYSGKDFDVVSAVDPMKRGHHLEIALNVRV